MKLLKKLYLTHSPSRQEEKMSNLVKEELTKMGIKDFQTDKFYQIHKLIPDTPLLCAHMDQIPFAIPATKVFLSDGIFYGDGNLGADDKNGVWILLKLLKEMKDKVSFIFSSQEEVGCKVDEILSGNESVIKTIKYGLVFDRRGHTDIIGSSNGYCIKEFEEDLKPLMNKYGYASTFGAFSDCNKLSKEISCINISCGYYEAHSSREFTIIVDLIKALRFGKDILNTVSKKYDKSDKKFGYPLYNNYSTFGYRGSSGYPWSGGKKYGNTYYCKSCDEYFKRDDIYPNTWCPYCTDDLYPYTSEKEYTFKVGDKVIILDKSEGLNLGSKEIAWKRFDGAYIHSSHKDCYFLSETKDGEKEVGMFIEDDLKKADEVTKDFYDDEEICKCYICETVSLEVALDIYDSGYILICPRCNLTFPRSGSYEDIPELTANYLEFSYLTPYNNDIPPDYSKDIF